MSARSSSSSARQHRPRSRTKVKQDLVYERLRREIIEGRHQPGDRLPVQAELADQFEVSGVTVQQAMRRLADEGFIRARPRLGTVVAPKLPHLQNLAVVFPHDPAMTSHYSRFYAVLGAAARGWGEAAERRVELFHGIDYHRDTEDRHRLERMLANHQLAGLIFASHPYMLENTPLLDEPQLPRVAIMSRAVYAHVPAILLDSISFFECALDYLVGRGRRRIAVVTPPGLSPDTVASGFSEGFAARGVACPAHWWQMVSPLAAEAACNVVRLLMQGPARRRPDGLIVTDDNLVEHAIAGLIAEKIDVPRNLDVVVRRNFPWDMPSVMPVRRLGYDCRTTIQVASDLIDRQRRGETVPAETKIPARFEDELEEEH